MKGPHVTRKPNIIYLLADDWGYGDVSCLNPGSKIPTPQTDRLAGEGIRWDSANLTSSRHLSIWNPTAISKMGRS